MLSALELTDFAIIDALRVDFSPGLNVLTGETGAGKSILVDALTLLIGGRADARGVRTGAESALVQGFFGSDDDFVTARRVQATGRSSARIAGELVTVAELAERGGERLAIHGQHASQTLLSSAEQRRLLDRLLPADAQALLTRIGERYRRLSGVVRDLEALQASLLERARQLDILQFQITEIAEASLRAGEEEEIRAQLESLRHAERIVQGSAGAVERLSEGEPNVLVLLAEAVQSLESAGRYHATPAALATELRGALESVQATSAEVASFLGDFEGDPAQLETLERRLSLIESLKLKYGSSVAEILAFYDKAQADQERLTNAEGNLASLQEERDMLRAELETLAQSLSTARRETAERLSDAVTRELRPLGMASAVFSITLEALPDLTASGRDKITFLLRANLGEAPGPLSAVASGGELSRVMLALNVVTGTEQPTLVFDEVDAGLGGETARTVGELLKRLAADHQVLVVTHLPQVAAYADAHFKVEKREREGRTITRVTRLSSAEREAELARMLSGAKTKTALAHARELLAEAQANPVLP